MNVIGKDGVKDIADATAEDINALGAAVDRGGSALDAAVNAFLRWPLPESVCSDGVATMPGHPHRCGTNLLTAAEARQMFVYLIQQGAWPSPPHTEDSEREPIEACIKHYESECCRFDNIEECAKLALRYAETMPSSHVRALLYTLAKSVNAAGTEK